MNSRVTPALRTKRKAAAIYREAARLIEIGEAGYSCCAIANVVLDTDRHTTGEMNALPEVRRYVDLFSERDKTYSFERRQDALQFSIDDEDHRVVLLCFMAAITERP